MTLVALRRWADAPGRLAIAMLFGLGYPALTGVLDLALRARVP